MTVIDDHPAPGYAPATPSSLPANSQPAPAAQVARSADSPPATTVLTHAPPSGAPRNADDSVGLAVAGAVSKTLARRGFLTSEWWSTVIGLGLTAVLAEVGVQGSSATQFVGVAAPTVLAAVYAVARTLHKSTLAALVTDLVPQSADPAS